MKYFNLIKVLFILKLCHGLRYIDLKNNYISQGVEVTHGYFMMTGIYKMFYAHNPPLEVVQYGHIRVFPDIEYKAGSHSLYVELFKVGHENVISIYVFKVSAAASNIVYKVYFQLTEFGYRLIDIAKFTELIKGKIHLSVDLSKDKNHPFFHIQRSAELEGTGLTIELRKTISGYRLRNVETKRYEFGRIFDSKYSMYFGYSKINSFVTKATSMFIRREEDRNFMLLRHWTKSIKFDFVEVNGKFLWNARIDPEPDFLEDHHIKALKMKEKIDDDPSIDVLTTLDIGENLDPEILGIEKVIGMLGSSSYTLYHHKLDKPITNKIKHIINSDLMDMSIRRIEEEALYTRVEILTNSHRTFLMVTSLLKKDDGFETVINYYDKPNMENMNYAHVPDPYQIKFIANLYEKYPVLIDFEINDPPSMVDHGEHQLENCTLKYYHIKEGDNRGTSYTNRYAFGNIWEEDPFEVGNIPYEGHKRKNRILAGSLNTDRFVLKPKSCDSREIPDEFHTYLVIEV